MCQVAKWLITLVTGWSRTSINFSTKCDKQSLIVVESEVQLGCTKKKQQCWDISAPNIIHCREHRPRVPNPLRSWVGSDPWDPDFHIKILGSYGSFNILNMKNQPRSKLIPSWLFFRSWSHVWSLVLLGWQKPSAVGMFDVQKAWQVNLQSTKLWDI